MTGAVRVAWPDGGSYLSQPAVTPRVFEFISKILADMTQGEANSTL